MALMRTLLIVGFCASLVLTAAYVRAEEDGDPFDGRLLPIELVMAFRKDIDLSKEQRQAIGKMVVELQQEVAGQQWEMQSAYFDLIELLEQPKIDEELAIAATALAVEAENKIKLEQVRLLVRVRNLLDAQQIAYLRDRLADGWVKD